MKRFLLAAVLVALGSATIIDRVAVRVGNAIIKDSDIQRDLKVTEFLNGANLDLSQSSRKKAVDRLIDQTFIRREIRLGDYPTATPEDAAAQLEALKKQRFHGEPAYQQGLARYRLTDQELKNQFQWQLTVLRFIDARFKPAAYVSDQDVETYYNTHVAELRREFPKKSGLAALREDIRNLVAGEKVNKLFFEWLEEQRKSGNVRYLEGGLA